MSTGYRAVGWNRNKRRYDAVLLLGIALYLALYVGATLRLHPSATLETALIRALGTGALLLLHVILSIGPLCRIAPRFLPLLYNRRHLGVSLFLMAAAHGLFALVQFHALGDRNPLVSMLAGESLWDSLAQLPFQPFGAAALLILFLMAATSHDFWLRNLTAPVWKALHMLVYVAWALLVLHVAFGAMQDQIDGPLPALLLAGVAWIGVLHLAAGFTERRHDRDSEPRASEGWVDACAVDSILEGRARTVVVAGERVAIFRWNDRVAALSNVCQHQNGPLGEGRIVDGCVTCPWHGYQYRPQDGCSPPPFTEAVPTFAVRVQRGRVLVASRPCAPGTPQTPARVDGGAAGGSA